MSRSTFRRLEGRGRVDMVADFAYELPALVIFQVLGIPDEDTPKIKAWAPTLLGKGLDFDTAMNPLLTLSAVLSEAERVSRLRDGCGVGRGSASSRSSP